MESADRVTAWTTSSVENWIFVALTFLLLSTKHGGGAVRDGRLRPLGLLQTTAALNSFKIKAETMLRGASAKWE